MIGQQWEEGNAEFHYWIAIPTLLIHGKHDKLVSIEDATLMQEVIMYNLLNIGCFVDGYIG